VCGKYGAIVYSKVRVADVLPIENSGISNDEYRFALQSHFDFVVTNTDQTPLFSVEFDGPTHQTKKQKLRDERKEQLCLNFDFPILRINARYLNKKYRCFDLLSWFVECWFFHEAFFEAQRAGLVPCDEPCDPMLVLSLPGHRQRFPLWLSADLRIKIQNLAKLKKIKDFVPSHWIGTDDQGYYHGIMWLRIDDEMGAVTHAAMRSQHFPIIESELLCELLVFQLYEELSRVLEKGVEPTPINKINERVKEDTKKYRLRMAGGLLASPARKPV